MATTTTKVKLCNRALIRLKKSVISSLDDTAQTAVYCNQVFDEIVEKVLAEGDWSHARKRLELGSSGTPAFGWDYAHTLPTDFVSLIEVNETKPGLIPHSIENGEILSDNSTMKIKYTYFHNNPSKWSAHYKEAFVAALALELAYLFRADKVLLQALSSEYDKQLMKGLGGDGSQDSPTEIHVDTLIEDR